MRKSNTQNLYFHQFLHKQFEKKHLISFLRLKNGTKAQAYTCTLTFACQSLQQSKQKTKQGGKTPKFFLIQINPRYAIIQNTTKCTPNGRY